MLATMTSSSGSGCSHAWPERSATSIRAGRRDEISNEAVELARRTGHDAALAYALDARTHALIAPRHG